MPASSAPLLDSTLALGTEGYAWLPDRWRNTEAPVVRTRLMGRHTVALRGEDAVRFFYDERHVERRTALPEPVVSTLFGKGAVHTLDGTAHRVRKELFTALLTPPDGVAALVARTTAAWEQAAKRWSEQPRTVLFDETSRVLARGVTEWAGVPVPEEELPRLAADLIAMVDGFGTLGPRHWRARRARARWESRFAELVEDVRSGAASAPPGSALAAVAAHRDADGVRPDARVAAVELLNVLRPTVAVSWFTAFAGHALHRYPGHRERLRTDDSGYAEAFAHEVRRFYPFAPFVAGRAVRDLTWRGEPVPAGAMVLLDLYGQDHDPGLWGDPYAFRPERFLRRAPGADELVPQGGGDPRTGHRCPGEDVTVALLAALATRLARLEYTVPEQDLTIPLRRIPTRPRSGVVLTGVRP
ncbi:cytochrome P450 [Streptomyces sp. TRM 70351]|uniref:cytochrome P450 n=1 Tax=Streptomyces sp. TRM 70351 TaxID=3116552 RepID=UPI002E7B1D7D|nr:cytochrome P450 [Streptomyces sp. TRM 70351]MEE1929908.1 cytochrome P450 [Streptomyces sp. TRM 70351]